MLHDLFLALAVLTAADTNATFLTLGACVFALGIALQVWSKAVLRRNRTLNTTGPYALCRHPFYLANAVFDLGICLMSGSLWLVAVYPFVFALAYLPTLRKEEAELTALFGEAYPEYRRRTPAILPDVVGLVRHRHTGLSWENLRAERQVSRVVRYAAFPILVVLAHRVWNAPREAASPGNLALLSGIVGLNLLSLVIFRHYEKRASRRRQASLAEWTSHYAPAVCAAIILLLSLTHDAEAADMLLAGMVSLLMVAWPLWASGVKFFTSGRSRLSRDLFDALSVALMLFGLFVVNALWLAPVALVLLLSERIIPGERAWADATHGHFRLAATTVMLAIGITGVGVFHEAWSPLERSPHVRQALEEETRDDDAVYVLRDDELHRVVDSPRVDAEVSGEEFAILAEQTGARRLFVLAEDVDLEKLPQTVRRRALIRRTFRIGLEQFFLVEILRQTVHAAPARPQPSG
ncbi:MAG TPA: isoprenylcysteine carboxylmethyltransferase family protein [Planctomycetota bacterium]|nr:isoprenylcysteine carboxylmethyltransferase family protein [Planctomycetota bacterium]